MTRVACLVVNYFSSESVAALLGSLTRVELPPELRVVIVDNSCDEQEWQRLEAASSDAGGAVRLVRSEQNLGYAGGNNLAFDATSDFDPEVVFVVNPDVTFDSGSLAGAAAAVVAMPSCAIGAKTLHDGKVLSGLGRMNPWTGAATEIPAGVAATGRLVHPMGHFLGMRADAWRELGGLSEDYFLFCEELDLALRLRRAGGEVAAIDAIAIEHEKGLTSGAGSDAARRTAVSYRHATRSRIVLYRSHDELKRYLGSLILTRVLWSGVLLLRSGPAAARAVLLGIRDGLNFRRTAE